MIQISKHYLVYLVYVVISLLPLTFFILNSFFDLLEDVVEAGCAHVVWRAALPGILRICRLLGRGRAWGGGRGHIICTSHCPQAEQILKRAYNYFTTFSDF